MFKHILRGCGLGLLLTTSVLAAPAVKAAPAAAVKVAPVAKQVAAAEPAPAAKAASAKPARAKTKFARWEGEPHVFTVADAHPIKVLFFHGAGQPTFAGNDFRPENELIGRFADALKASGLKHEIHSLPWETNPGAVIERLFAEKGPFIISGHSAGGAFAEWLTRQIPEKFIASFLLNPATKVKRQTVPTLVVRGTRDFMRGDKVKAGVTLLAAEGGDHSLRYRLSSEDDKATAARSPETRAMNLTIARGITDFLAAQLKVTP